VSAKLLAVRVSQGRELQLLMKFQLQQTGPKGKGSLQHPDPKPLCGQNTEFCVNTKSVQKVMGHLGRVKAWHFFLCLIISESLQQTSVMFSSFSFATVEVKSVF